MAPFTVGTDALTEKSLYKKVNKQKLTTPCGITFKMTDFIIFFKQSESMAPSPEEPFKNS